ncbi:hypothetical protein LTR85_003420 [Meristemomyces frigidus]|nr:hypothetical protein LTR85_003420 [Meristemomyces frigidus]
MPFDAAVYVRIAYNPHCVSLHNEDYGRLVLWEKDASHRWDIVGYPRARLVLQAQEALSSFLRRMVELNLKHQLEEAAKGHDAWNEAAARGFTRPNDLLTASARLGQPFSAPPTLDLPQLVQSLRSRCNAAADELWLLQVDPVHTKRYLGGLMNTPFYDRLTKQEQQRELVKLLLHPVIFLQLWQSTVTRAENALSAQLRYRGRAKEDMPDPTEYRRALCVLQCTLESQLSIQIAYLGASVEKSSTFGHLFRRKENGQLSVNMGREDLFHKEPILWNVAELCDHGSLAHDPSWHVAFIEDLIAQASPDGKACMDNKLYAEVSNVTTASDAISALRYNRPHHGPKMSKDDYDEALAHNGDVRKCAHQSSAIYVLLDTCCNILSPPVEAFLELPLPAKRVTEQSVPQTKNLHIALGAIWNTVRTSTAVALTKAGKSDPEIEECLLLMSAGLTATYQDELKDELEMLRKASREKITRDKEAAAKAATKPDQAHPPQAVWGSSFPERSLPLLQKQKTRPDSSDKDSAPRAEPDNENQDTISRPASLSSIAVSSESQALFASIFTPQAEAISSVRWEELVAAVVDAGCSVTHNGGSAVTFKYERRDAGGTVVVHRPHPDPSVDHVMLKTIGKRLRKWFGWDAYTFVERS